MLAIPVSTRSEFQPRPTAAAMSVSSRSPITSGLPPHIAQIICGHASIETTLGYKAIYPAEAIEAHRAFIARRRATRPGEEYRTPTDEEWDSFLAHFEKRKVSVGTCARAFGSPCVHEHSCDQRTRVG